MKLIWIYLFLVLSTQTFAQITLDNTITSITSIGQDFFTVQISETETKYLFEDTVTNTFSLFNMDFTPFLLNIAVPEPFDNFTYQVLYVSRSLFDCDTSNIEYVFDAANSSTKTFYIMRTDGTQLFSKDSVNGPWCLGSGCLSLSEVIRPIRKTSAGTKLFLQRHRAGQATIFIYSLCGTLPVDVFDFALQNQESYVTVFPNPSSSTLILKIIAPDNMNEFEIVIFNNNAQEIERVKVNSFNRNYSIDMRNYSDGTYYYSLCTKGKSYQSGKFILTK